MASRLPALLLIPLLVVLDPGPRRAPPCPPGHRADEARAAAILAALAADAEGRDLVREAGPVTICFGAGEPGITPEGVMLLEDSTSPARAAHLLSHRRPGSALSRAPEGDCAMWVSRALDEEARAYALELDWLGRHGAVSTLPFAEAVMSAPRAERARVIRRWLDDHPRGGGGVPALGEAYARRCAHERR